MRFDYQKLAQDKELKLKDIAVKEKGIAKRSVSK